MREVISPRLKQLLIDIKLKNKHKVLEDFWLELIDNGTPLLEIDDSDLEHVLATFIIKKENATDEYVLISTITDHDLKQGKLQLLEDTNIYFITYRVPNKTRTTYYFGKNFPEDFNTYWQKRDEYSKQCLFDPFNQKKFTWPKNDEHGEDEMVLSILELNDADKQIAIDSRVDVSKGSVHHLRFHSKLLNNERSIWVYVPYSYKEEENYPLLVMVDGFEYTHVTNTPNILDNLIYDKKIPPVIGIFIGNVTKDSRDVELTSNLRFSQFIVEELIPNLQEKYSFTTNPNETVIGGASYGGLCALTSAMHFPFRFGNVLSQSGAFWYPDLEKENSIFSYIKYCPKTPIKIYLEVGKLESQEYILDINLKMNDILLEKGYCVFYTEVFGGHDHLSWGGNLASGLIYLLN